MKQKVISSELAKNFLGDYIVDAFNHDDDYTLKARLHNDSVINLQLYATHILGTISGQMVVSSDQKIFEVKYGGKYDG